MQDKMLLLIMLGQLVLMIVFVPAVSSVSLTVEREQNTLEMLYGSQLTEGQIIRGKVLSAIAFPTLLLVAGLPFVALMGWRGDVNLPLLLYSYAILFETALLLAIVPLAISTLCNRSATSLVLAYTAILLLFAGSLVPAAIMLQSQDGWLGAMLHYGRGLSGVAALLSLLLPDWNDLSGLTHGLISCWKIYLPLAGLVIIACYELLVMRLGGSAAIVRWQAPRKPSRHLRYLIDPHRRRRPIGRRNPALIKELRGGGMAGPAWMIRIFYGSLLLSLCLAAMSLYGQIEYPDLLAYVLDVLVAAQFTLIAVIAPSLTSPSISNEIESGTFETLRMTPLSGRRILAGKFAAAMVPALLPVLALLPAYATVCFINETYLWTLRQITPVILLSVVFSGAVGLLCSAFFETTARATVAAYGIIIAVFLLPIFAFWAKGIFLNGQTAGWIVNVSPLGVAIANAQRSFGRRGSLMDGSCLANRPAPADAGVRIADLVGNCEAQARFVAETGLK